MRGWWCWCVGRRREVLIRGWIRTSDAPVHHGASRAEGGRRRFGGGGPARAPSHQPPRPPTPTSIDISRNGETTPGFRPISRRKRRPGRKVKVYERKENNLLKKDPCYQCFDSILWVVFPEEVASLKPLPPRNLSKFRRFRCLNCATYIHGGFFLRNSTFYI